MTVKFKPGKSYPIKTLPDDLHDETIPNRDRWAIRDALFWNDCQGWWMESIADVAREFRHGNSPARFWSPLLSAPMTRDQILTERGMVVCPECDIAIEPFAPHDCRPSAVLIKERELQARADSPASKETVSA